jgi:hypothetical protein
VFENRVLRRIFGPKRDEVTGEWRKLHTEELHNLYSSPDIRQVKSGRMRWAGYVAHVVEKRKVYKVLMRKPEGKRPLGRPRCRWEDGIRMGPIESGCVVYSGFRWLRIGTISFTAPTASSTDSMLSRSPVMHRLLHSCSVCVNGMNVTITGTVNLLLI